MGKQNKIRKLNAETVAAVRSGEIELLAIKEFSPCVRLHKLNKINCSYVKEINNILIKRSLQLVTAVDQKQIIFACKPCNRRFVSCKAFDKHKCISRTEISCVGKFKGFDNVEVSLVRFSETHINAMKKFLLDKF